MKMRRTQAKIA